MKTVIENPDVQRTGRVGKQGRVFLGRELSGKVVRVVAEIEPETDPGEDQ